MADYINKIRTTEGDKPVNYEALANKPNSLPNPNKIKFTGSVVAEYDGSSEVTVNIPNGASEEQAAQIQTNTNDISELKNKTSELKGDLANSKKAIAELNDKKITKFYASNLGETNLSDSDNGKIQDMMLYGKSIQNGTPTPDNPIEIQSVVNPKLSVCGKNLFNATLQTTTKNGVTCTNNGDGTYTLNGTASDNTYFYTTNTDYTDLSSFGIEKGKTYKLIGCPSGGNDNTGYSLRLDGNPSGNISDAGNGNIFTLQQDSTITYTPLIKVVKGTTCNNLVFKPMITKDLSATYDDFEPYKEQSATLPYTLNAIPVSDGGNVTIDGQQYIADYVDIENKQLVRRVDTLVFDGSESWELTSINTYNIANFRFNCPRRYKSVIIVCDRFKSQNSLIANTVDEGIYVNETYSLFIRLKADRISTTDALKTWLSENNIVALTALYKPTTIDLTDEEFLAFKALTTHYPTTNVNVASDQLDGYTTFNYPLNMKNGWDYIKEQLGDTREYIYDMELQSAEAYVNSEYAVTLTELEV